MEAVEPCFDALAKRHVSRERGIEVNLNSSLNIVVETSDGEVRTANQKTHARLCTNEVELRMKDDAAGSGVYSEDLSSKLKQAREALLGRDAIADAREHANAPVQCGQLLGDQIDTAPVRVRHADDGPLHEWKV